MKPRRQKTVQDNVDLTPHQMLLATEDQWLTDRLRGVSESTERLLHADYFGSTPRGVLQSKADFLESVRSCKQCGIEGRSSERTMRIHGRTAISTGTIVVTTTSRRYSYRYLRVYVIERGEWSLIASQATELAVVAKG